MKLSRLATRRAAAEKKIVALCEKLGKRYRLPQTTMRALRASPHQDPLIRQLRQAEAVAAFLDMLNEALEMDRPPAGRSS